MKLATDSPNFFGDLPCHNCISYNRGVSAKELSTEDQRVSDLISMILSIFEFAEKMLLLRFFSSGTFLY